MNSDPARGKPPQPQSENQEDVQATGSQAESADEQPTIAPVQGSSESATIAPDPSVVATPLTAKRVGDYDLLEEIARGGMGVVYKAKHRSLNRLAAVKMVLGGNFSSEQEQQRFKLEAESAAKLDHPAIVPIYEIGDHQGQPYFAMKYVDGGSLADQSTDFTHRIRDAVEIMVGVAEGVHHAHQRGVLHRDLKPANILLDQNGDPYVTDLGLAKSTTGGSDLTHTGAVLGTPSYMPPEQAAGSAVTTAADIYSLGAILYEALVGQPPYQGESAVSIVMKVIEGPPDSPSKIKPSVNRDLELVCLKCMNRDPAQRYSSAQELANDLRNWLDGKAISVKPPTVRALLANWLKQNQRLVYAMFAIIAGILICAPLILEFMSDDLTDVYANFPDQQKPFIFSFVFPRWISSLAFLFLFLVLWPSVGLLNAVLSKSTSLGQAISSGLAIAFFVSLIVFCMLGWIVFLQTADSSSGRSVQTLANAVWPPGDDGGESERQAANALYGGLDDIPISKRGQQVTRRIRADQFASVTWAFGVLAIVISIISYPIIAGTILGYALINRQIPKWLILFRYIIAWWTVLVVGVCLIRVLIVWLKPTGVQVSEPQISVTADTAIALAFFGVILWLTLRKWSQPKEPSPLSATP